MYTEEIIKLAFDLGNAIAGSDEIKNLKEIQTAVSADEKAYELIISYQDARMKTENKSNSGLEITKAEQDHLDILEQMLHNNAVINNLMQAQEKFDNLMQSVYYALNQAIAGNDCSGGCDSCGGSCSSCS